MKVFLVFIVFSFMQYCFQVSAISSCSHNCFLSRHARTG